MKPILGSVLLALSSSLAFSAFATPYGDINAAAARDPIRIEQVRGPIHMLSGSGGNIGVLAGSNGILLVDSGIAVSQRKIEAALQSISGTRVRYAINTHWHWDHTEGNAWVRRTGATVIAGDAIRRRLSETNRIAEWEHTFTPIGRRDQPDKIVNGPHVLRFSGEVVRIRPYQPGHTDGDLSVYFERSDVLQTGDTFWNGVYPFIDYVTGGSIDGAIRAARMNIEMAGPKTRIIPGHGPIGSRTQLIEFRDMLIGVRRKVAALKAEGKTADEAVAAKPTAQWDAAWGRSVINGSLFTRLVYEGV
jgi:glyoxylase-like metal-dependent hydrolase (beta-lactamase superfamily II)